MTKSQTDKSKISKIQICLKPERKKIKQPKSQRQKVKMRKSKKGISQKKKSQRQNVREAAHQRT